MKAAKRSILICVLTLILSVSLLAGVTFAWFTDSITNSGNTIQSGELAIDATAYDRVDKAETDGLTVTIGEGNVASGTYYFEAEGASLRNGDPVITEDNWQPGDMNAKLFTVSNEGSIDAVVSLDFFVSGDLAQYLWYDFIAVDPANGTILGEFLQRNDLTTLQTFAADREFTLSPAADLEDGEVSQVTFLFVYGLPTSATNEAMNKAVNVNVVVSAKQNVEGAEGPVVVNPGTDLSETLAEVPDNSTVVLSEGNYIVDDSLDLSGKEGIVIDGNGATLTTSDAISGISTLANNGGNIIQIAGASNVTIRNLTISGAEHHGINIWESTDVVVENVTIENSGAAAITINASEVTLNNVTTSGSAWGGVNVDEGDEESTIKTVLTVDENCAFGEFLPIYADSEDIANAVTVNVPENYNKAIVDLTGIGEDGVERVVWSSTIVETADELNSALVDGGNIIIANDITVNSFAGYNRQISTDVTVYLNNKTVTSTQTQNTTINGYSTLNLVYGSLVFNNMEAVNAASLLPITGSTVTLDNVILTSNGTALYPRGDAAAVNVFNNSVVEGGAYAIGTNAGSTNNYNVIVTIKDSTVQTKFDGETTGGGTAILFNVPGTLNVENSTVAGVQNAVAVRGGTAVIKNSTLTTAEQQLYPNFDSFMTGENAVWGSGNAFPYATLLVGDRNTKAYNYSAFVTLVNTEIKSGNAEVPTVYIWQDDNKSASLIADYYTQIKSGISGESGISGKSADNSSVFVYLAEEGEAVVTSFDELKSALEKGGDVVLANEITVTEGDTTLEVKSGDTLRIIGAGIININGTAELTIVNNGRIIQTMQSEVGYLFRASGNSKLTLNGDGEYVAGLTVGQADDNSVITVNGGSFNALVGWSASEDIPETNWIFNLIDDSNATISVTAGTFVNYDPSNSQTENPAANFVAEGYVVNITTGENGTPIYTVVPEAQQ